VSLPNVAVFSPAHQLSSNFRAKLLTALRKVSEESAAQALQRAVIVAAREQKLADVSKRPTFLASVEEEIDRLGDERVRNLFNRYLSES
jgi:hypothetical protein